EDAADATAQHVAEAHRIHVGDWRRALDDDWITPGIAALIYPEGDLGVVDIDDISHPVAIHIADQDSTWVVTLGEPSAVAHMDAPAPVAVPEVRPIFDVTVVHQDDVLQAITRHIAPFDTRVGEIDVGELVERTALDPAGARPSLLGIVEEAFQAAV